MQSRMAILTTSYTSPRLYRSWDPRRKSFWNDTTNAVSIGTLKVSKTCTIYLLCRH